MTFRELLQKRRSVRDYEQKVVAIDIINEILQEATLAPSASNNQPCRFVVINCRETIKRLSDESKANLLKDFEQKKASLSPEYVELLKNDKFNVFYNAPCLIYIVGSQAVHSLEIDCALMASYIMFAAASRGLGTCWIGLGAYLRDPKLKAELGIPEGCRIVAPLIIGYPKEIPAPSPRNAPNVLRVISQAKS
ncbi:MAG TPA: nitroreductase family protein [Smithellaceae bacterium]|nr:nitroreductase family protein [Smithellaceae bacterium]HRS88778.1 nitroreductase family protein [Smithellaceae bacterium]HRV25785.1 nitroreductase family protein [Smithellaceae bacterium]